MCVWLLALLLLLNLCDPPTETRPQPVPAPPPAKGDSPASALPGRLLFLAPTAVTLLEEGELRTVPVPAGLASPALSPDGLRVAGLQGDTLVVVDLTTGENVRVERTAVKGTPLWSPDGSRVAIFAAGADVTRLLLFDAGGTKQGEVLVPVSAERPTAAWAPGGGRLALTVGPQSGEESTIWLGDVASGSAALFRERANGPLWTPDGQALIFEDSSGDRIVRAHLTTGAEATVLDEELLTGAAPSLEHLSAVNDLEMGWKGWSSNGQALGVVAKSAGPDPRFLIITVRHDGSVIKARVLPLFPDHPKNVGQYPPRPCSAREFLWDPRGDRIAALLASAGCDGALSLMREADLAVERDVTVPEGAEVRFSPDGEWLVVSDSSGAAEVISVSGDERIPLPVAGRLLGWLD